MSNQCADHSLHEIKRAHSDRHVGVVYTSEDGVVVNGNEMRMCRQDLDESDKSNVADYERYSVSRGAPELSVALTVLVDVLEEALELVDASRCERLPVSAIQHASDDGGLDALVQQRHGGSGLDQLGQWWD